jgi:mannose-1-phosphate guanylyltransferase / mannose-6-phosphate isomerase
MSVQVSFSDSESLDYASGTQEPPGSLLDVEATRLCPVVLAGGSGTRLWPLSRKHFPKQLVAMPGPASPLQTTVQRLTGLAEDGMVDLAPIVVCGTEHRVMIAQQMAELGINPRLVVEPEGHDTAPALSLAAMLSIEDGNDSVLVVMPASHLVLDEASLRRSVLTAARSAELGAIVVLGVRPTRPDTDLDYIKLGAAVHADANAVERFIGKPPLDAASEYVASGDYYWNSGIVVVRASVWLATLQRLQPAMHEACFAAFSQGRCSAAGFLPHEASFARIASESIHHAIMEHLPYDQEANAVMVPLDASWSDMATWNAVWDVLEKDYDGNVAQGRVMFEAATSCYAHSEGRLITCLGVTNLAVIETADALLVVDRSRVQDVRGAVERLTAQGRPEANLPRKVQRPWGCYDSLDQGERYQVKRIVVRPGARLSLQLHHHRAEHWVVVHGTALVTRGEETFLLSENESTYIPIGVRHRLENPGKVLLEIVEVQSGCYVGEDDIVRFEDQYGRAD